MKIIYKNIEVETEKDTTVLEVFKETLEEKNNILYFMSKFTFYTYLSISCHLSFFSSFSF